MNTQIIKVYYGSDALPYKDRERVTHFPITGSTFVGSSDTTKIRFYVDGYLADESALWISVSRRADGTQGSQFLTTGTDENGDKYREMPLSGWYTEKKGDLYISLKGYQGGSTGYWDNETGMYIVQGVPVIKATGSIKLAINYAPVGEYPYYEDEMASFQDLVAQLGNKLNITSGIKVVSSTSSIIIANEEEGQLFYSKADKKLYQLVSGNIVVFFETYDKDTLDTKFSGKVDKLTTSGKYVYAHITAQQGEIQVGEDVINNAIPNRTNTGQLKVPTTPTDNSHATSKQYVDDNLSLKADKATTYTKTETDNAIASAVSSVYKYKGSVPTYSDLPASGNEIGDVYNVEDTGDNYAWAGTYWDKLSGTVDLSGYYTKTETNNLLDTKADKTTTYTKTQTDTLLGTKADKATTYTKVQTDELLNEKANISGEYQLLTVGKSLVTEQIENINDEVGSTQTNPFLFQGTGTNDNTTETPTSPVAKHLELRGNSVVWNQLVNTTPQSEIIDGITFTNNGDGSWTLNGTATANITKSVSSTFNSVENHIYLLTGCPSGGSDLTYRLIESYTYNLIDTGNGSINTLSAVGTKGIAIDIKSGTTINNLVFKPQLFDLTAIYGAGKEPTTLLQFNRDYPLPYYEYNAGELKSCSSSKLVTIGCNQLNELNTFIKVIAGQTYELSGVSAGGYVQEYDIEQNLIKTSSEITSTTQITLTNNTHYVKVQATTYSNAMFRLYWNETHEYEPYIKHEYNLPNVELRSAGVIYDEIKSNGLKTTRIGIVIIDNLTQNISITQDAQGTANQRIKIKLYDLLGKQGAQAIICCNSNKYVGATGTDTFNHTKDKIISQGYESNGLVLFVYDSDTISMTDQEVSNYIRSLGLIIYYSLNVEIQEEESAFAENIEVDDFGTMEFIPSDSTEEIIVPQGNKFFYPADYVLFIDDMYNRSKDGGETSSANNFVTQSELQQAVGDIDLSNYATKNEAFNVINASEIGSNNQLTQAQYDLITNGKPTRIVGTLTISTSFILVNPIIFPIGGLSGVYYNMKIVGFNLYGNKLLESYLYIDSRSVHKIGIWSPSSMYVQSSGIEVEKLLRLNSKNFPSNPSDTGTFVNKMINGTWSWAQEWYGTQQQYDALGTYDSNTIYNILES